MGSRRLSKEAQRAAEVMARDKLAGRQARPSVVADVASWLTAAQGYSPGQAVRRARLIATAAEEELTAPRAARELAPGAVRELWRTKDGVEEEGEISATNMIALDATIIVEGPGGRFEVSRAAGRLPWYLYVGATPEVAPAAYSTMTAARAEARMRARGVA